MSNKIDIRSVKMEWLNSQCLMQISKYTRARFDHDAQIMNLRDADILQQVIDHAHLTESEQLKDIYRQLKQNIKTCLADNSIAREVSCASIPDYLIADSEDTKVPRREVVKRWFNSNITSFN